MDREFEEVKAGLLSNLEGIEKEASLLMDRIQQMKTEVQNVNTWEAAQKFNECSEQLDDGLEFIEVI